MCPSEWNTTQTDVVSLNLMFGIFKGEKKLFDIFVVGLKLDKTGTILCGVTVIKIGCVPYEL